MLPIFESILPIFLLVVAGAVFKRMPLLDAGLWPGLETFGYYILFPALLFLTLGNADFSGLSLNAIGMTALLAVFVMFALCLALYPLLDKAGYSNASFTSVFQTATRWNGFVALAIAERYAGTGALAIVALVMAVNILPLNVTNVGVLLWFNGGPRHLGAFAVKTATNPLILGCLAGLALQAMPFRLYLPLEQAIDLLARSALGLGLVMVGAGLRLSDALRPGLLVLLSSGLKLIAMPLMMIGFGLLFGLSGQVLALMAICGAVPTAMNGFLLARQLGGDAPLYAAVATLQTAASFLTIPAAIALAEWLG
ncbi:AEC family transporter [Pseudohoeflea coraliihabitans]|uniref:AEC family transporter n=1 Tax=Pseudohoeflea coraliihabitans TaxID=2860393 RepID=A0ABS6WSK5_9HYPH|nr:AEC family transporter [Pseudohoeflea sp. DP4N28-3]MBW3098921.1 AEC family transporter [Pseudohoeflea sp. DP4N28-3]